MRPGRLAVSMVIWLAVCFALFEFDLLRLYRLGTLVFVYCVDASSRHEDFEDFDSHFLTFLIASIKDFPIKFVTFRL